MMNEHAHTRVFSTDRLTTLADGVFAIVLTLLVLDLHAQSATSEAELLARLRDLIPQAVSFLISFVVLGVFWYGHHMEMHWIVRSDRVHIGLTLGFLLTICFVPFSASLLGKNQRLPIAAAIYAGNLAAAGLMRYVHWMYATSGSRLTVPNLDSDFVRHVRRVFAFVPACYAIAGAVAWASSSVAMASFALIPVLYVIPARQTRHLTSLKPIGKRTPD